jgi:integrase
VGLFKRGLAYNSVRTYIFSLSVELKLRGGKNFMKDSDNWFIHSTLKHYKRTMGTQPINYRRPITIDMLPLLVQQVDLKDTTSRTLVTMIIIGVFGCFRIGELCFKKTNFIKNSDVSFNSTGVTITLHGTKTDSDKKGVKKFLADIKNCSINPCNFLRSICLTRKHATKPEEPLFVNSNGKPINRQMVINFIRKKMKKIYPNIPSKEWNGISLRKGGATSAMRAGISSDTIQQLGNWRSELQSLY